jgi:hypothetical protein
MSTILYMTDIQWSYETMRAWYLKQAKYVDETKNAPVFAFVYESKKPSKSNSAKVEPFVTNNMKWANLSPIQDKELFPNNLYTLLDGEDSKKQWLFFVFPTVKEYADTNKELFADHFSFCLDPSDKKKPCHFHSTQYTCIKALRGAIKYASDHINDFMPDKLRLPTQDSTIFKKHTEVKDTLLSIIKYPWMYDRMTGGAKSTNRAPKAIRPITGEPFHREFCDKWTLWGIKRLSAIGIRKGNLVHWSVSIFKGRLKMGRLYRSLHYTTPVDNTLFERELWRRVVQDFVPWW